MSMSNTKVIKSETLPLLIPANWSGETVFFQDDQYIRNKKLTSLFVTPGVFGQTYIDNKRLQSTNELAYCYLTLESYTGVQFIRKKPLLQFINYNNSGVEAGTVIDFIGQRVNWPKSYVEFGTGAPMQRDAYILFDVHFTELSKEKLVTELGTGFNNKR